MRNLLLLFTLVFTIGAEAGDIGNKVGSFRLTDSRRGPALIRINSCGNDRYKKLESLSFVVKTSGLKIYSLAFSYEDRNGGRASLPEFIKLPSKEVSRGNTLTVKVPSKRCVDSILISGTSLEKSTSRRSSHLVSFDIFAKTK